MTDAGRGRVPRTDMGTGSALAVLGALQDAGVRTWLIGGWAIDALVGRQRRPHDDLDLLIPETDVPPAGEALERLGYAGAPRQRGASYAGDRTGRQVSIHVIAFRSDGSAVYWMGDGCDWVYPAGALEGR